MRSSNYQRQTERYASLAEQTLEQAHAAPPHNAERLLAMSAAYAQLALVYAQLNVAAASADARFNRLVEYVADLHSAEEECTCGYGGDHEPQNERCNRSQVRAGIYEELTS